MRQAEHDHTCSGLYTMRQEACAMVSRMATVSQSLANKCQAVRLLMLMQEVPWPDGPNGQMANRPLDLTKAAWRGLRAPLLSTAIGRAIP